MIEQLLPYKMFIKQYLPRSVREWIKQYLANRRIRAIVKARALNGRFPFGVNVFGAVSGASGLSEASRTVVHCLENANIPVAVWDVENRLEAAREEPYIVNLMHVNPNQLPELLYMIPEAQWQRRYNIGFWVWEQEVIPTEWKRFFPLFDEIWTPSEFSAAAIRRETRIPVSVIPHTVCPKCDANYNRKAFDLPENLFLVLLAFDCNSVVERKNPKGAIKALNKAFQEEKDGVGIVIKARNLTNEIRNNLEKQLSGWKNVFFITEDYPKNVVNSLIRLSDIYVSLHRAEGFGLILAEAMYLGTPVVATNWSGNTEFMNESVACMVHAKLVPLKKDHMPFKKGSRWAEPDVDEAARFIRKLYLDRSFRKGVAECARERIRQQLSYERVSEIIKKRMEEIFINLG